MVITRQEAHYRPDPALNNIALRLIGAGQPEESSIAIKTQSRNCKYNRRLKFECLRLGQRLGVAQFGHWVMHLRVHALREAIQQNAVAHPRVCDGTV